MGCLASLSLIYQPVISGLLGLLLAGFDPFSEKTVKNQFGPGVVARQKLPRYWNAVVHSDWFAMRLEAKVLLGTLWLPC